MASPEPGKVGDWSLDPGRVELIDLKFKRLDFVDDPEKEAEEGVTFEFSVLRSSPDTVVIVLAVKVVDHATVMIEAHTGTILTVTFPEGPGEDVDAELAGIVAQVGPVILYPYARELIADLTRRAGFHAVTLPVYQIGNFFTLHPSDLALKGGDEMKTVTAKETRRSKQTTRAKKSKSPSGSKE